MAVVTRERRRIPREHGQDAQIHHGMHDDWDQQAAGGEEHGSQYEANDGSLPRPSHALVEMADAEQERGDDASAQVRLR